jgi:hypothetical protein
MGETGAELEDRVHTHVRIYTKRRGTEGIDSR